MSSRRIRQARSCAGRALLATAGAIAVLSCAKGDKTPVDDSAADTALVSPAAARVRGEWASELGRALLVPADNETTAVVLFPDAALADIATSAPVTLLTASGDTTAARVASILSDSVECGDAATVRFKTAAPMTWSVGLLARSAPSLRMDSIEALPAADSARLATDLARLASALPMPASSRFTGLPFAVLDAYRFAADERQILVAQLVRRISQEAAPIEERTFIIAEREASAGRRAPFVVTYSQRSEGSEDTAEHFDVLAAIRGRASTMLLLARDQLSQATYELLERKEGEGEDWRVRWSRTLSC